MPSYCKVCGGKLGFFSFECKRPECPTNIVVAKTGEFPYTPKGESYVKQELKQQETNYQNDFLNSIIFSQPTVDSYDAPSSHDQGSHSNDSGNSFDGFGGGGADGNW